MIRDEDLHKIADEQDGMDKKKAEAEKFITNHIRSKMYFLIGYFSMQTVIFIFSSFAVYRITNLFTEINYLDALSFTFLAFLLFFRISSPTVARVILEIIQTIIHKKPVFLVDSPLPPFRNINGPLPGDDLGL